MSLLTGLLAHWKLEEASGTRYDSHGSYDLAEVSGVGRGAGKIGYAAEFPDAEAGYFTLDTTSTALALGDVDFTVALWAKVGTRGGLLFQWVDGIYCYTATGGSLTVGSQGIEYTAGTFSTSTWHHIVIDFRASDNRLRVHLDGSTTTNTSDAPSASDTFIIGDDLARGDRWIDSFSVWDRILTDDERTSLYNGGDGLDYESFSGAVTCEADFDGTFSTGFSSLVSRSVEADFPATFSTGFASHVTRLESAGFSGTFSESFSAVLVGGIEADFGGTFTTGFSSAVTRSLSADFAATFTAGFSIAEDVVAAPDFVGTFTATFSVSGGSIETASDFAGEFTTTFRAYVLRYYAAPQEWPGTEESGFAFQRAPTLRSGDKLDSEQLRKLAKAFNDRLPYFDNAWRIAFYVAGLFRQMRNPDSTGFLYPAQLEFFEAYQSLERGQGDWPLTGPSEPEGANVSNPLNAFIWGNEFLGLLNEAGRMSDVTLTLPDGSLPSSPVELWELAKLQRGSVDMATGVSDAPAWSAARSWAYTYGGPRSPHGNAYGCYAPSPAVLGACQDPNSLDPYPAPYSVEVLFTATEAGIAAGYTDKTYAGTCPIGPSTTEDYSAHVAAIYRTPWAFLVVLNSGQVDTLPRAYYVEGPYSGTPVLRKTEGGQLVRALSAFSNGHRGIEQNIGADSAFNNAAATKLTSWLQGAFKAQDFLTSQYALSPARGGLGSDGLPKPIYPKKRVTAGATKKIRTGSIWTYKIHAGCVAFQVLTTSQNLFRDALVTVTGTTAGASAKSIQISAQAPAVITNLSGISSTLTFALAQDALFSDAAGFIEFEIAELAEYKPDVSDAVLVQRLTGDPSQGVDTNAETWAASLQSNGCVVNAAGRAEVETPFASITDHPVYQAARQWSKCVRIIPPRNLYSYSVEGGKSVLWFKRYAAGTGGSPSRVEIPYGTDGILAGREYVVEGPSGGGIDYASVYYAVGDHFFGVEGVTEYFPASTETVYLLSNGLLDPRSGGDLFTGIAGMVTRTAPKQGFTNRWVLGAQFKAYHPSVSSLWKPSAYGDYFGFNDRCTFFSPEIANENDKQLLWHFSYGQRIPGGYGGNMISECPTGYRYAPLGGVAAPWAWAQYVNQITVPSANFSSDTERDYFHKSARIYEPDLEIDSAKPVTVDGIELVKVTLTSRLHNTVGETDGASANDLPRTVSSWDLDALQAEPFRTTENALRMFVAHQHTGRNFVATWGDSAANSYVQSLTDNPYATCWPHIYLVKMLPEPYDDGNTRQDAHDSPLFHDVLAQAETYLRAMCEACVDHEQSLEKLIEEVETSGLPASWGLHDYTFDELCRQAFGGAWIGSMPSDATTRLPASAVRPDNPHGFGPVPHTYASAELFNRISSAVNLLTKYRVMLPWTLETRELTYTASKLTTTDFSNNYPGGETFGYKDAQWPLNATALTGTGAWAEVNSAEARKFFDLDSTDDSEWRLSTTRVDVEWRASLQHGVEHALPPYLSALWDRSQWGILAWFDRARSNSKRQVESPGTGYDFAGNWYSWPEGNVNESSSYAAFVNHGTMIAPELPGPTDCGYYYKESGTPGVFEAPESPGGSQSSLQLTLVPGQTMFVEVPLVD